MLLGSKMTDEQREALSLAHMGQTAWNLGKGGCKRGHDSALYVCPPSGVYVCLGCKRENGFKYREKNRKEINLKNRVARYSIDINRFHGIYDAQEGNCAICKTEIDLENCRIDHSHITGEVRGILCVSCNTGIGLLKDSADVLMSAAEYLRKNNG